VGGVRGERWFPPLLYPWSGAPDAWVAEHDVEVLIGDSEVMRGGWKPPHARRGDLLP